MKPEHYAGLHSIKKEQKQQNHNGLATPDSSISTQIPNVETRSLATYAALEEGDS